MERDVGATPRAPERPCAVFDISPAFVPLEKQRNAALGNLFLVWFSRRCRIRIEKRRHEIHRVGFLSRELQQLRRTLFTKGIHILLPLVHNENNAGVGRLSGKRINVFLRQIGRKKRKVSLLGLGSGLFVLRRLASICLDGIDRVLTSTRMFYRIDPREQRHKKKNARSYDQRTGDMNHPHIGRSRAWADVERRRPGRPRFSRAAPIARRRVGTRTAAFKPLTRRLSGIIDSIVFGTFRHHGGFAFSA